MADPTPPPGFRHHPGEVIDGFTLTQPLGRGGNGEVWRAEHPDHGVIALKLLAAKRPDAEKFRRFRREVEVHQEVSDHPGVLPLLAAFVPEERGQAWLATPVAIPFDKPAAAAELSVVVDRLATVAETLAWLHARGNAHRDIKPGNLLVHGSRAVIGDFGLVDDPRGEDITAEAGILGPRHYVAWEVIEDPQADWRPADVYALAKTIWVVVTGQRYPQPGAHAPEVSLSQIGSYTPHPWAGKLDDIIAAATRLDVGLRISAAELAANLRRLEEEAQPVDVAAPDEEALRRLGERLRPSQSEAAQRNSFITHLRDVLVPVVNEVLWPMQLRVREVVQYGTVTGAHLHENALLGWRTLTDEIGSPEVLDIHKIGY
jgi:serine/threonine protein kinase